MQLNHYNTAFQSKTFPITIVCENVTNAPNIGSLLRVSDAFGVEKIIFCGEHIPFGRKIKKTSRATEKTVNYELKNHASDVVNHLKSSGYTIIALEITDKSMPIHLGRFSEDTPIALIVGDENFGVSEASLSCADYIYHINMFGKNSSMNVVQATNIAIYEITKQLNLKTK